MGSYVFRRRRQQSAQHAKMKPAEEAPIMCACRRASYPTRCHFPAVIFQICPLRPLPTPMSFLFSGPNEPNKCTPFPYRSVASVYLLGSLPVRFSLSHHLVLIFFGLKGCTICGAQNIPLNAKWQMIGSVSAHMNACQILSYLTPDGRAKAAHHVGSHRPQREGRITNMTSLSCKRDPSRPLGDPWETPGRPLKRPQ